MAKIPVEVSAKHIHLSQKDLEILFGVGYVLKEKNGLTQPGQFSAKETLDVKVGDRKMDNVRVVGPTRKYTQIEISLTDGIKLGITPPVETSGSLKSSLKCVLIGPKGKVKTRGIISALRHIHCNPKEAKRLGIKNGQMVSVKISGKRGLVFNNIKVRVDSEFKLSLHLDTDEGNAAGIIKKSSGTLL